MLIEAIGDSLPSALAVALSPIPIIAVVLLLGSARARAAGSAFALGWMVALLAVSLLVLFLAGTGSDPDRDDPGLGWLKIGIGVLFLVMAGRQWARRPGHEDEPRSPKWMKTLDRASPGRAALLGATLAAANPKNLALTLTAVASIAESGLDSGDKAVATAVFILIGSTTIAGAVLFRLVAGERATSSLAAVKQFMADNNAVIMMIILLLLGANLLGDGLGVL